VPVADEVTGDAEIGEGLTVYLLFDGDTVWAVRSRSRFRDPHEVSIGSDGVCTSDGSTRDDDDDDDAISRSTPTDAFT